MSWFLAFAGFALLIILHEVGHFAAAKAVGMRVERFVLFFPPLLFKVRRGETEYGIGAIPLGGFVKITGMNPNKKIPEEVAHRAYYKQKVWKRIVVILAGPAMNVLIAFVLLWGYFVFAGVVDPGIGVNQVTPKSPAAAVLKANDKILAVNGVKGYQDGQSNSQITQRLKAIRNEIQRSDCAGPKQAGCKATQPVNLLIERAGKQQSIALYPTYDGEAKRMLLGVAFGFHRKPGVLESAQLGTQIMGTVSRITVSKIAAIFYDAKARKEVSGVVGSYEATRQTFAVDWGQAVVLLALISLSLAIINLFPFLPLDGGHVFWALAEKIRGKAIPFSVMQRAGLIGFALVIGLFLLGLTNDIGRLSGEGFGIR